MIIINKKTWEFLSLPVPRFRGPEIAHLSQNEQPKTPRRYEVYRVPI